MHFIKELYVQDKKTVILFFCLVFLFYGTTLKNKYSLDDDYITVTNFPIKGQVFAPNHQLVKEGFYGIPKIWVSRYAHDGEGAFDYRPVVTTTFAIEYGIFGQNPFISHLINVLLYFLTICALYICLLKLLHLHPLQKEIAFIAVLLFLIHPIHSEVVASLKSRDEILSLLFSLLFFYQSIKWAETSKIKHIIIALIFIFLAFFSKISAILFLTIVPLSFFIYKKIDFKKIIILASFCVISWLAFRFFKNGMVTEKEIRNFYHFENPLFTEQISFIDRFFVAIQTLGFYIKMLIFPYHLKFYYGVNAFELMKKINIYFVFSIGFIISSMLYLVKSKSKDFLFSFILFLSFIFPFLNFVTPVAGIVGERLCYFSSIGFCLMLGILIAPYYQNLRLSASSHAFKKPAVYFTLIIFICLIYVNQRNSNWYNKITLFEHDIPYLENSAKANSLLANEYFEMLRSPYKKYSDQILIRKCIKHYELAQANDSSIYTAYNNEGVVYYSYLNDISRAKTMFILASKHKERYAQAYENLGNCYKQEKNEKMAIKNYKLAIMYGPQKYSSYIELVKLLFEKKEYQKSLKIVTMAISYFPNNYELIILKGNCYLMMTKPEQALPYYEEGYILNPSKNLSQYIAQKYLEIKDTTKYNLYINK